jgi:hypothetical protein
MGINQERRQASVRAIAGTSGAHDDDWRALFARAAAGGGSHGESLRNWINARLGSGFQNVNDAMQAFARDRGAASWDELGSFDAAGTVLDYNFVSEALNPALTFSRASTGTRFNSSGVLVSEAIDAPRFDYGADGSLRGLLVEPERQNIALHSQDYSNAAWVKTQATIDTDGTLAPDGVSLMQRLVESASVAEHFIRQDVSVAGGETVTYSKFAKAGTRTLASIRLNHSSTGFVTAYFTLDDPTTTVAVNTTNSSAHTILSTRKRFLGNGIYLLSIKVLVNTGITRCYAYSATATNTSSTAGSGNIYFWGSQIEIGAQETSYIKTEASAVTRAPDVLKFTPAAGVTAVRFTFDDRSTQDVSVTPEVEYTVPTDLNRSRIRRISDL